MAERAYLGMYGIGLSVPCLFCLAFPPQGETIKLHVLSDWHSKVTWSRRTKITEEERLDSLNCMIKILVLIHSLPDKSQRNISWYCFAIASFRQRFLVLTSHGHPLAFAQRNIPKWPCDAASMQVHWSQGQPCSLAHISTSSCPLKAAQAHTVSSHGHPFASAHSSTSITLSG